MNTGEKTLAIVVPCYKEEEVLNETTRRLTALLNRMMNEGKVSSRSRIVYVNDGSTDNTWNMIAEQYNRNEYVCGVNLARNVGQQNAMLAGMEISKEFADAMVTIDADLQDDVNAVSEMMDRFNEGYDIVYGVRSNRESDTWLKRNSALAFYRLMKAWGGRAFTTTPSSDCSANAL